MATTSTSDSTPWTTRRSGTGGWLRVGLLDHHTHPLERPIPARDWTRWKDPRRVGWSGHVFVADRVRRTDRTASCIQMAEVGAWVSCPIISVGGLLSVGHQVTGPHGWTTSRMASRTSSGCSSWMLWPLWVAITSLPGDQLGQLARCCCHSRSTSSPGQPGGTVRGGRGRARPAASAAAGSCSATRVWRSLVQMSTPRGPPAGGAGSSPPGGWPPTPREAAA